MRNEEKAVKLFGGVTDVGDDLIEEAGTAQKRKKTASWRWGLVAACLCAVLLGTAFAANPEAVVALINRLSIQFISGRDLGGYEVRGKIIEYSPEQFSPELLALCEATKEPGSIILETGTWEKTRIFVGGNIPFVEPKGWSGEYRIKIFCEPPESGWKPTLVEAFSVWPGGGEVYTGRSAGTDSVVMRAYTYFPGESIFTFFDSPENGQEHVESYTMPDGTEAEIIMSRDAEDASLAICAGYFIKDGVLYEVRTHDYVGSESEMVAHVKTLLDSFC